MNPTENSLPTTSSSSSSSNNNNNLNNPIVNNNYVDDDDDDENSNTNNNHQTSQQPQFGGDDEEFLIHLQFDEDSHPLLRYSVDDCKILGIHDGKLLIRIGDSFFFGHLDNRQQTSVLFAYEPNHKFIQEIHKSFSKIIMKRVILKPKEDKNQQQPTIIKMDTSSEID
ncbi:uncharacterized protein LOC124492945 [Dermatophagoides farinae]|uniref:uncharacterized protein LOC124492945 n=1 Tax=Dermatophagoides farinae TaxID=6954 RepID=UPI003F5F9A66